MHESLYGVNIGRKHTFAQFLSLIVCAFPLNESKRTVAVVAWPTPQEY